MHIDLHERSVADAFEAMHFTGLDDQDITSNGFELFTIDVIQAAALSNELDLIIWMTVRTRAAARSAVEEEDGTVHIAVVGADEVMRAAPEWKVFLTNSEHTCRPPS